GRPLVRAPHRGAAPLVVRRVLPSRPGAGDAVGAAHRVVPLDAVLPPLRPLRRLDAPLPPPPPAVLDPAARDGGPDRRPPRAALPRRLVRLGALVAPRAAALVVRAGVAGDGDPLRPAARDAPPAGVAHRIHRPRPRRARPPAVDGALRRRGSIRPHPH